MAPRPGTGLNSLAVGPVATLTSMRATPPTTWQSWLQEFDFDITDDTFLILNEPNPMCAFFPEILVDCGSLPTAEEIEVCTRLQIF